MLLIHLLLFFMIKKHTYKKLTWIDLFKPTKEEVLGLMEEYDINPSIANDLLSPSFRQTVDAHENFIYLILHFPALKHTHSNEPNQEIDFLIGKDFIITSRYDDIDSIHKFSKVFDVNSVLEKEDMERDGGYIFLLLMKKLYASIDYEIEYIQDALEKAEDSIFKGEEKRMVQELSKIGRDLLNLKQATNNHQSGLESLQVAGLSFLGDEFSKNINKIINEYHKIRHNIAINVESLNELRYTNNSLLSTKQNETMTILTIMAFVTFPLSLLASIFGMNTQHMPIIGSDYDFWKVLGIMLLLTTTFSLFFKYKKWL